MPTFNITTTIVDYKYTQVMLEAGWEFIGLNPNANAYRSSGSGSVILRKQGDIPTRSRDGLEIGLPLKRGEQEGDGTIPSVTAVLIPVAGDIVRIQCDEKMSVGPSGPRGFLLVTSGNPIKVKFQSIPMDKPNTLVYITDRPILKTETNCLLSYIQPAGGVQDLDGNDLPSFTNTTVANNSNQ